MLELAGLKGLEGLARIGKDGRIGVNDKNWQDLQDWHDIPQSPDTFLASLDIPDILQTPPDTHQITSRQPPKHQEQWLHFGGKILVACHFKILLSMFYKNVVLSIARSLLLSNRRKYEILF